VPAPPAKGLVIVVVVVHGCGIPFYSLLYIENQAARIVQGKIIGGMVTRLC
jgi:hypothetical protein